MDGATSRRRSDNQAWREREREGESLCLMSDDEMSVLIVVLQVAIYSWNWRLQHFAFELPPAAKWAVHVGGRPPRIADQSPAERVTVEWSVVVSGWHRKIRPPTDLELRHLAVFSCCSWLDLRSRSLLGVCRLVVLSRGCLISLRRLWPSSRCRRLVRFHGDLFPDVCCRLALSDGLQQQNCVLRSPLPAYSVAVLIIPAGKTDGSVNSIVQLFLRLFTDVFTVMANISVTVIAVELLSALR